MVRREWAAHGARAARLRRQETAWLSRDDTLEVDALVWLPWLLIATRADYTEPLSLVKPASVRIHPFFGQILSSKGGGLLKEYLRGVRERRVVKEKAGRVKRVRQQQQPPARRGSGGGGARRSAAEERTRTAARRASQASGLRDGKRAARALGR